MKRTRWPALIVTSRGLAPAAVIVMVTAAVDGGGDEVVAFAGTPRPPVSPAATTANPATRRARRPHVRILTRSADTRPGYPAGELRCESGALCQDRRRSSSTCIAELVSA